MIRKLQNPVNRYIKYFVRRADNNRYQIKIIYFVDKGNPITDIDAQYEKTIFCEERNLQTLESKIARNISKTQNRLERAYCDIGALPQNVYMLVNEKMR